eukprot:EG_transcript_26103
MADLASASAGASSYADSCQLSSLTPLQGSPSRSLNARRLRLQAEREVQCLTTRIARLKAAEAKAQRDLQRAAARARAQQEFRQDQEEWSEAASQQRQIAAVQQQGRTRDRQEHLKTLGQVKQRLLAERQETYQSLRKERAMNECRVQISREEVRERNTQRREELQHSLLSARLKRDQQLQARREQSREQYEERVAQEEVERIRQERRAQQLAAEEARLAARLAQLRQTGPSPVPP